MNHESPCTAPIAPRSAAALALIGIAAALAAPGAGAAQLETLVVDVAAQSGYPTYRAPELIVDFLGGNGVGLPFNGLPVGGLAGVERLTTAVSDPLVDGATASGSDVARFGLWSASGSSSANAAYGKVGAAGSGTMAHFSDANTVAGFERRRCSARTSPSTIRCATACAARPCSTSASTARSRRPVPAGPRSTSTIARMAAPCSR